MTWKDNLNNHIHQMDETSCFMDEFYDHKYALTSSINICWIKYVVEFVGWILPCINEASVCGWKFPYATHMDKTN